MSQLQEGTLFANRFALERIAGSGGMGTVYRARDRFTGDFVALKLLHLDRAELAEAERFRREAQLLAELRHSGIVSYVAHGQTPDGQSYLAMEWLEGTDLAQRLSHGPLPLRDALLLIQRAAEALTVAHQRGIIHRDLKPTNLFLPSGDIQRVKLLDFGIARRSGVTQALTRTGLILGTPEYMAPEQARGSRELTPAADVFSLGCVLYECLTGEPPFVADHITGVLVRILFEEPAPVAVRRTGIPESVSELVRKMLHKDAAQRLADASVLTAAIADLGEFPERPHLQTLTPPRKAVSSFAESEQVLFSVVIASPKEEAAQGGVTVEPGSQALDEQGQQALHNALSALGVMVHQLAGSTLVVTVPQVGSATDQATLAARAALLIKKHWPGAAVSLATGRGSQQGQAAIGEVVDRAVHHLRRRDPRSATPAPFTSGIWLDDLSARLLEPHFSLASVSDGMLLTGEGKDADASRPLLGKPTPCVGREAELCTLEALFTSCIDNGEARAALITAPPGIGKSRLRHEFLRRVAQRREPLTIVSGRGELISAGAPYGILGQALRRLCHLSGSEPLSQQQALLWERLGQHVPPADQKRVVTFLGELAGVPFPSEGNASLLAAREDPRIMRARACRAFLDWLRVDCQAAPVLLVLDDLHWGDALSVALLDEALHELRGAPLLILALARPEIHEIFPKLWQSHQRQDIPLKGLSKKSCERLIYKVLGRQLEPAVVSRLIEQSTGNALFLEELIRAAAEGTINEQPITVLAMLQARIGQFNAGPRKVLRAASVFGQRFRPSGVAAVLGLPKTAPDVESWLTTLVDAELIEPHSESGLTGEIEYGFRHVLMRDAAYSLLTDSDLATGHLLAGKFLAAAGETEAAVLAGHFERGGETALAAHYFSLAAEHALDRFALELALRHVERGIACGAQGSLLGTLRAVEAMACSFLGHLNRVYAAGNVALPLVSPGSRAWCRTIGRMLTISLIGPPEWRAQFPMLAAQLLQTEPEADAESLFAEAISLSITGPCNVVPPAPLMPGMERLEQLCNGAAERNPTMRRFLLYARSNLARHVFPSPWKVAQYSQEGVALCQQAGDIYIESYITVWDIAAVWAELGDPERAIAQLRSYLTTAQKTQLLIPIGGAKLNLASLLVGTDDPAQLEQASALAHETIGLLGPLAHVKGHAHDIWARVQLHRGQPAAAEADARLACRTLAAMPSYFPTCHATLIRVLLAQGRAEEATEEAEQTLRLIQHFGGLGQSEVELRLAISQAFYAAGDRQRANTELQETLRQIKLRADDILDPFWRNSYLTRNRHCVKAQQLYRDWAL